MIAWCGLLVGLAGAGSPAVAAVPSASVPADAPAGITIQMLDALQRFPGELGPLPRLSEPADGPHQGAKVELGRMLFFDTRLSRDAGQSCASCHDPQKGFSDGRPRARGFHGRELPRRSPSLLNAAYNPVQFWDGRASSLEQQVAGPLLSTAEMNMTEELLRARLASVPEYRLRFQALFGGGPTLGRVAASIAAFERTLVTPNSRFDAYAGGDKQALSDREKRGLILFVGKAACSQCHNGANFTDNRFHRIGLRAQPGRARDAGRFAVTGREEDRGAFKTPSLRNVALCAPYMHDGSLKSLEEVIDFYARGGDHVSRKSALIFPVDLQPEERADLIAFLKSLTGAAPIVSSPLAARAE